MFKFEVATLRREDAEFLANAVLGVATTNHVGIHPLVDGERVLIISEIQENTPTRAEGEKEYVVFFEGNADGFATIFASDQEQAEERGHEVAVEEDSVEVDWYVKSIEEVKG